MRPPLNGCHGAAHFSQCMSLGRPPSLAASYVDCELPEDDELSSPDDGSSLNGCQSHSSPIHLPRDSPHALRCCHADWQFRHEFLRDVFGNVLDGMVGARAPPYARVLEYDRQIRQSTLPNVRLYLRPDEANYSNPSVVLRSFFLSHFRSICALKHHTDMQSRLILFLAFY